MSLTILNTKANLVTGNTVGKENGILSPVSTEAEFYDAEEGADVDDLTLIESNGQSNEETKLGDENQPDMKSKILSFFSVLRKFVGVKDLSNVRLSLPTQLIEPISNLEDWVYVDRPDLFASIPDFQDPEDRMLAALRFWQSKDLRFSKGKVSKPLNPILGETFRCTYKVPVKTQTVDGALNLKPSTAKSKTTELTPGNEYTGESENVSHTRVGVLIEQISHHPPVSAYHYSCPEKGIEGSGIDQISARFGGTSVKVFPGPRNKGIFLHLTRHKEVYCLTHPTAIIGGFLLGNPTVTVSGRSYLTCPETQIKIIIQYIDEKLIGKPRFLLEGVMFKYDPKNDKIETIKQVPEAAKLGTLRGSWRNTIYYTKKGEKEKVLIDFDQLHPVPKTVRPDRELEPNESRRVWGHVIKLMKSGQYSNATKRKIEIEEKQRELAKERKNKGEEYKSAYFVEPEVDGRPFLNDKGKEMHLNDVAANVVAKSAV